MQLNRPNARSATCRAGFSLYILESQKNDLESFIPTRTERHALAQSRRPMGMTRYSLRSENPGMSQPSRGLVLLSLFGAASGDAVAQNRPQARVPQPETRAALAER